MARSYVAWVKRNGLAIVAAHLALLGVAIWLIATRLPLYADFSYLLPQDVPAVRDLRRLESRVKASDTILVIVDAPTSPTRAAAVIELADGIGKAAPDLIEYVEADDAETRAFLRDHRYLLVPIADLERAKSALAERVGKAKQKGLYIELGDPDPDENKVFDDLLKRRRDALAALDHPSNVSENGRVAMIQVRTTFRATDAGRGERLIAALDAVRTRVVAKHPGLRVGFTGGIVSAVTEHDAIFNGIIASSLITALLVAIVLALYFRSATLLALLIGTLGLATALAFGLAAVTVGHLNGATAFLGAIIAGNGINYGILLIARYLEERRTQEVDEAMATAIEHTLKPTAIASLGAAIAYGSLYATSFKGFADFALIGALGMIVCWIATYLLFPALVLRIGRTARIYRGDSLVGSVLVRLLGFRNSSAVCMVALGVALVCGGIVVRYVAADPFEYDIKNLRSEGSDAVEARSWMAMSDANFGRGYAGRTYIAADRLEQVPQIVDALRARDRGLPPDEQTIGKINSILDVVPDRQDERIRLLRDVRGLIDEALPDLDPKLASELTELRPPDTIEKVSSDSLPSAIRDRLTEKDGRVGYIVAIRPADKLDEWNGRHLIRFANAVRELKLADNETVTTSGSSVIFADIVQSITHDGPIVTAIAAAGLVVMVLLLVGRNRRALAVLAGTAGGSLLMVATCALLDLRVNFLDFVALPITLGLGIDYAINIAHRHDQHDVSDPRETVRTSGSAVFVCSLTTIIGYGSLLVSDNLAIRGFGLASLIGEIACVFTALVLVPALLAIRRQTRGSQAPHPTAQVL